MSVLAWLFGLGGLAIAFPLLFHLIRRTPKGQTQFGSLMFLRPSPPRITRRSRLENLLLLLLRAAAIILIAFAFMRPFVKNPNESELAEVANRRVAILLDTSASMRRNGLWPSATGSVEQILDELETGDDVALVAFDDQLRVEVGFADVPRQTGNEQLAAIRQRLAELQPGWGRSDLGQALVNTADDLDVWRDRLRRNDRGSVSRLQVYVVSDMQKTSRIAALQSYQWPRDIHVKFVSVQPGNAENASIQLVDFTDDEMAESVRKVRIKNAAGSSVEQFHVSWGGGSNNLPLTPGDEQTREVYVPRGTSKVMTLTAEECRGANQFTVSGDNDSFDNTFFTVPSKQQQLDVGYLGPGDADDPEQMHYYLARGFVDSMERSARVYTCSSDSTITTPDGDTPELLVVTAAVDDKYRAAIDEYLESGGVVMIALPDLKAAASVAVWAGIEESIQEGASEASNGTAARRNRYAMISEIDFSHPLFAPFAGPRFNDFTRIRFWNYRQVKLVDDGSVEVLARLDNDWPLVWQRTIPQKPGTPGSRAGRVFVLASGWQPSDSQLALSSKFVPLLNGLLDIAARRPPVPQSRQINEPLELSLEESPGEKEIIKPDGSRRSLTRTETVWRETDQPGIYTLRTAGGPASGSTDDAAFSFAVNLDPAESESEMIPIEQLEKFGIKTGEQATASAELTRISQLRDRELESGQKLWKWLIITAIGLLVVETCVAGRIPAKQNGQDPTQSFSADVNTTAGETS